MSERAALARRVLDALDRGEEITERDAFALRGVAPTPEDAMLTLREIALEILGKSGGK